MGWNERGRMQNTECKMQSAKCKPACEPLAFRIFHSVFCIPIEPVRGLTPSGSPKLARLRRLSSLDFLTFDSHQSDLSLMNIASPSAALPTDSTGRFAFQSCVGRGGMGTVFEAFDQSRKQRVALKMLSWLQPVNLYRFKKEFRSLTEVVHRNLVSLFELISVEGDWYCTMEFIDGADFVTTHQTADGLVYEQLRDSLEQLVEAVHVMHIAGKLHRDLKPYNVLVTAENRVVVLDFGLVAELASQRRSEAVRDSNGAAVRQPIYVPADEHETSKVRSNASLKQTSASSMTTDFQILGTAEYMSPEQANGGVLTPACDWYSVGVMLYELLTGSLPFVGSQIEILMQKQEVAASWPESASPDVPTDLREICLNLLSIAPEARFDGHEILRRMGSTRVLPVSANPLNMDPEAEWGEIPFVGRDEQLAALRVAFAASERGKPCTLHVSGRSGVGKTVLVERFLDELQILHGCVVLTGRCYEEETVPFKALDSLIDSLSRCLVRLPEVEVGTFLPQDVAALARLFPVLRRVNAIADAPPPPLDIPNVQELRRRAFSALRELISRLSKRHPLVLWVDDLQWGDVDSIAAFAELLRPVDPQRLLLLFTYREEDIDQSPCLQTLFQTELHLGSRVLQFNVVVPEMSPQEAAELASTYLRGQGRPNAVELAERISVESRGIPYFVFELARSGSLGRMTTTDDSPAWDLDNVLWARIGELPDRARLLLEYFAISGQPMARRHILDAAGSASDDLQSLNFLRASHLIRVSSGSESDEIETYHDRIRETVVSHLSLDTRQHRHRRLAIALEADGKADPARIAVHFRGADRLGEAARYFHLAGDKAAVELSFERAAAYFRESLQSRSASDETRAALLTKIGDALANAGRGPEAAASYVEAADVVTPEDARELIRRAALQYCISGHLDEGRSAFRVVLKQVGMKLPETPAQTLLSLLFYRACLRVRGYRFRQRSASQLAHDETVRLDITESVAMGFSTNNPWLGSLFQTRHLLLSLSAGEPVRIAVALSWEAAYASMTGGFGAKRTQMLLELAKSLAEQTQDPHALGSSSLAFGIAEFLNGRYLSGRDHNARAEQLLRDRCTGVTWEQDTSQIFGLWSLFYLGQINELRARYLSVFQEAHDRGDRYLMTTLGTQVGTLLLLARDEPQAARATLDALMSKWTQDGFTVQHHNAFFAEQAIDLYEGKVELVLERLESIESRYRFALLLRIQHIRIDLYQLKARSYLIAARTLPNRREHWLRQTLRCIRQLRSERMPWSNALASFFEAGLWQARQYHSAASHQFVVAARELDDVGMVLMARVADWQRSQIEHDQAANELRDQALNWFQQQEIRDPERLLATFG